jgi:UvrD-like helicase family protein/AAA domain-containing protein
MSGHRLIFVTGDAGTGKTTQLMKLAGDLSEKLIIRKNFQSVLAITHMHGARRRIDGLLRKEHPGLAVRVTTIDSFSLDLVNRWRRALGHKLPVTACPNGNASGERYGTHHVPFREVLTLALRLLDTSSVRSFIADTYPLIIVDEFQDCGWEAVALVGRLASVSQVIAAADEFQDLTSEDNDSCEAVAWLKECKASGAEHIELSIPHRTNVSSILYTAHCLRENIKASSPTIEKFAAPTVPMLAWKIAQAFLKRELDGTCAIICPTADPQLDALLDSANNQLAKRGIQRGIRWNRIKSSDRARKDLLGELGLANIAEPAEVWKVSARDVAKFKPRAALIGARIMRFAKLTGAKDIDPEFVRTFAEAALHSERSYGHWDRKYEVTTVHGAKNREFDHVFVFWGYCLQPTQRRKLLYNAITRAKKRCVLLVQQSDKKKINSDPALSLLGEFPSPIPLSAKPRTSKKRPNKTLPRKSS